MRSAKLFALSALAAASVAATTTSGKFTALSFNVAGLPEILNSNDVNGSKTENAEELGKYFAEYAYDIIQMQEDFNYHAYIYEYDDHPYRTATSGGAAIGSGLNTISNYDWVDFTRVKWNECSDASESDCLTPKGFTFMRWNPSEGVYIDFYNLHADAGTEDGDETARNSNLQQVADYIDTWSTGNAVVVMGDTNSRYTRSADTGIRVFKSQSSLTDVWVELEMGGVYPTAGADSLMCDNPSPVETCETVDKVLYRGSSIITLTADSFLYDGEQFLHTDSEYFGDVLSDHNPVLVNFSWALSSSLRQSEFSGGPHGNWFNDLPNLPSSPVASVLTFRGADRLDAVALELTDGTTFSHGGNGGTEVSLTLATGEYWTQAELCTGQYNSHTRNFYIKATTSAGNFVEAGTPTDNCTTFTADEGYAIVGYMGQGGDEMDQLAFIYAAY
ncbi:endonuclease/exonuclease/phosphatase family protein [Aspergillus saccharolyticus JOP 1030-1]|uniref:Mannose-binding lectin n=1 Tax=Aspergillus saccharolyticus JOP 1030-1 TaxID=1450539 RepID=A0A318Z7D9_9EURO|nr:mannose-binding lectin [Aspergillus saccharolyticus JOP 1030-1]PYH43029.1 mannose-binding lectin [Aspergillus saccharolyticus JOP 1030-1]